VIRPRLAPEARRLLRCTVPRRERFNLVNAGCLRAPYERLRTPTSASAAKAFVQNVSANFIYERRSPTASRRVFGTYQSPRLGHSVAWQRVNFCGGLSSLSPRRFFPGPRHFARHWRAFQRMPLDPAKMYYLAERTYGRCIFQCRDSNLGDMIE
jgi:hypothetical protein